MTGHYSGYAEELLKQPTKPPPSSPSYAAELLAPPDVLPSPKVQEQRGAFGIMKDIVTGKGQSEFPDMPSFKALWPKLNPAQKDRMAQAYMASADERQIGDIAVKTIPGATQRTDKFGNVILDMGGKGYYIAPPGFDTLNFAQLVSQTAAFLPAAKFGALAKTLPRRMMRTGAASAGTSAALDVVSGSLGSEQGISTLRAAVAGGAGSLFEGLVPLAVRAWQSIFARGGYFRNGKLTRAGRIAAKRGGLDPDEMGERLSQIFAREARDATDPVYAAQRSAGQEFGIPLTKGQQMGLESQGGFKQLSREEATRHGAYGDEATDVMRSFDAQQQQALNVGRDTVQARLGGETSIAPQNAARQTGEIVGEGLTARSSRLTGRIDDAYDAVRNTTAHLSADGIKGLTRRLGQTVKDFGIDPQLHPATIRALKNIGRMERRVAKANKVLPKGRYVQGVWVPASKTSARVTKIALQAIETERRKIGNLLGSTTNRADRTALTRIKREFDSWLDDAFDAALFEGDDAALATLKEARSLRREYGRLFQARNKTDDAGKVVEKMMTDNRTPEEIANYIFGRGYLGSKESSVRIAGRLKEIFGADSPQWQAIREFGWVRLTREVGKPDFRPALFSKNLNRLMETNRTLMGTLYTAEERALMTRFRTEVARTITPTDVMNPSKTAFTASRLIREWVGRIGTMLTFSGNPLGGAAMFTAKRVPGMMGRRAAKKAVRGLPRKRPTAPGLVAPLTAGTTKIPEGFEHIRNDNGKKVLRGPDGQEYIEE